MAIKVYILKKSIMKSSIDEYLEMKAELKERKKLEKQMNPESTMEQKQKKELRAVFVSESDTALQALEIAGISYEGDIDLDDIEFCKVESQQKCICGNLHIPRRNDVLGEKIRMYFFANRKNIVIIDDEDFAEKIIKRIIASRTKPGQSRERFLYNFCAKFMDEDLDNLGRYEKKIMGIEEEINEGDLDEVTEEIALLRKELLILREYYDEMNDFGKQLEENENNFFSGNNVITYAILNIFSQIAAIGNHNAKFSAILSIIKGYDVAINIDNEILFQISNLFY